MAGVEGGMETVTDFLFLASKITVDSDCCHKIKTLPPWKKSYDKPRQCIKKRRHHFAKKSPYSQSYGFSYSHVQTWELDHTEGWMFKNWWLQTVCWRRLLRVPWTTRRSNLKVNPKENQSWIFIGKTGAEALATWCKEQLTGKDRDAGKDWR